MSQKINIQYCGDSGCSGAANKLKTALKSAFPDTEINSQPAAERTDRIEVAWHADNGEKTIVWSKSKVDTEGGHAVILGNLRSAK